ncbi:flagellar biosynthetic protein FliO [Pontibacillus salicampi]|uniref:Flagellar biosynthetic protein FliO n=1 Tax=Pontibacillus salicampi TaxID=1449801 RepID=A0ABV6LP14_9BACI
MNKRFCMTMLLSIGLLFVQSSIVNAENKTVDCMFQPEKCQDEDQQQDSSPSLDSKGEDGDSSPSSQDNSAVNSNSPSLLWQFVKLIGVLIFIIALIYGLLKFVNKRNKLFQQVRTLENVGGVSLGQNKSLQVIRIGEQYFAVGVGDNVELLTEITDEATLRSFQSEGESSVNSTTASLLENVFSKTSTNNEKKAPNASSLPFKDLFQSELGSLKEKRKQLIDKQSRQKEDRDD